ncbi:MAG: hypothetical protein HY000_35835 [Planctomycetes bacterium]|nr:hypothetical protein [Planctomycetota bacterium]
MIVGAAGCATHADRLRDVRSEFYSGNVDEAGRLLDKKLARHSRDTDVLKLDRSMVDFSFGRPRQAEQLLREIRDRFDYLEQTSLPEHALASLTDDQRIAYAGEDYEKVLIRGFLALANLLDDGGDAAAYGLQVTAKQHEIIEAGADETGNNPKLSYKRVALGAYIHGLLREETHSNYDDAERAYQHVAEWEPSFVAAAADLERVRNGRHSAAGNGVLYVFTLVGRGPYKEQVSEIPTTAALFIADRIISHTASHTLPPTIAPVKVPRVVLTRNSVTAVGVRADGRDLGTTETITDVGQLAVQQFQAIYPRVMARAIARRAIKKGVVYAAKETVHGADSPLVSLALDAGGVAWEATEAADTRCWGLLPDKIQVLRVELPAGEHRISLRAVHGTARLGPEARETVHIAAGRNTYLLANFPDTKLVGTILAKQSN